MLAALRAEHYGYTLRRVLAERGLEIDEGTLYPLLRRLEAQGLLASSWREEESRPRRYYRLSPDGKDETYQRVFFVHENAKYWEEYAVRDLSHLRPAPEPAAGE